MSFQLDDSDEEVIIGDKYRVVDALGKGAQGEVFLLENVKTHKHYASKLVSYTPNTRTFKLKFAVS